MEARPCRVEVSGSAFDAGFCRARPEAARRAKGARVWANLNCDRSRSLVSLAHLPLSNSNPSHRTGFAVRSLTLFNRSRQDTVGSGGFEPPTSSMSRRCHNQPRPRTLVCVRLTVVHRSIRTFRKEGCLWTLLVVLESPWRSVLPRLAARVRFLRSLTCSLRRGSPGTPAPFSPIRQ